MNRKLILSQKINNNINFHSLSLSVYIYTSEKLYNNVQIKEIQRYNLGYFFFKYLYSLLYNTLKKRKVKKRGILKYLDGSQGPTWELIYHHPHRHPQSTSSRTRAPVASSNSTKPQRHGLASDRMGNNCFSKLPRVYA